MNMSKTHTLAIFMLLKKSLEQFILVSDSTVLSDSPSTGVLIVQCQYDLPRAFTALECMKRYWETLYEESR